MRPALFFWLRLRLNLENTAELLNSDSLTQTGTKTGGWSIAAVHINTQARAEHRRLDVVHGQRVARKQQA